MFATLLSGELAALEIGNVVVQYKKKSNKRPDIIVDGVRYVWNGTLEEYGRWGRNQKGGAFFTRLRAPLPEQVAQDLGNAAEGSLPRIGSPSPDYQKVVPPFERNELTPKQRRKYQRMMNDEVERLEKELGRPLSEFVLPDGIYGKHIAFPLEEIEGKVVSMPTQSNEYSGATVDKYGKDPITGKRIVVQRRVYDLNGNALQDFDYCHSKFRNHFFPHVHIWINRKRSEAIPYEEID